jgi:hypothetical protein
MNSLTFTCPKCGSANVKQIGAKHDRCFKPFTDGDVNETVPAVSYALQCECGVAFTETVREPGARVTPQPAT